MTNANGIGYDNLGTLPPEEAVDLLEQFGHVPDWVETVYIAHFRKMRSDLWERAYRVFNKRHTIIANTTPCPATYREW